MCWSYRSGTIKCKYFLNTKVRSSVQCENDWRKQTSKAVFASVFSVKTIPQESLTQKERSKEDIPFVKEDWVREHRDRFDITSP